jgi:hypothetical protein
MANDCRRKSKAKQKQSGGWGQDGAMLMLLKLYVEEKFPLIVNRLLFALSLMAPN